jgi:hypothetical protein
MPGGESFFTPQLNATITGPVAITGNVDATIEGTPAVTVDSGSVNATIEGTPDVSISGDITFNNTTIDVVGSGGTFPVGGNTNISAGSLTVPAGTIGTITVGNCTEYTAFNLVVNGYCSSQSSAGAPLQCLVEMQWYDSASFTQILDDDSAWIWIGNSSSNLVNAFARGSMQSSELILGFHNPSTTQALTVNWSLDGTGRTFTETQWWQAAPPGGLMNSGLTMLLGAGLSPTDGTADDILCLLNVTPVAASTDVWQPLPLKAPGLSNWYFNTSVALAASWALNIAAGLVNGGVAGGAGQIGAYWVPGNVAATPYSTQLVLPKAPLYFVIHTSATASNVGVVGASSKV